MSAPEIIITFNKLEGLARRPISHTCTSTLELSSSYSSLTEFTEEFLNVIANLPGKWIPFNLLLTLSYQYMMIDNSILSISVS